MNTEKSSGSKKNGGARNKFEDEFRALPLDKKLASLFRMEAATLEETFSAFADASMKVFEKAGAVITEFGKRVENEVKKATATGKSASETQSATSTAKKKGGGGRKEPPKKQSSN